jgi:hypothetical protein
MPRFATVEVLFLSSSAGIRPANIKRRCAGAFRARLKSRACPCLPLNADMFSSYLQ